MNITISVAVVYNNIPINKGESFTTCCHIIFQYSSDGVARIYDTYNKLYKGQPTEERYTTITMTRAREFLMATGTNKMAGTKKL